MFLKQAPSAANGSQIVLRLPKMPLFKYPTRRFHRRIQDADSKYFPDVADDMASKAMRKDLIRILSAVPANVQRKEIILEMQAFFKLFNKSLSDSAKSHQLDWRKVSPPAENIVISYDKLVKPTDTQLLNKLAVLKVNGGLGTTMSMAGAKSALEVRDGMTFLDFTIEQIEHLNATRKVDVPLIVMTSFGTSEDTLRIVKRSSKKTVNISTFNQSKYPRIYKDSLLPCPKDFKDGNSAWYPPGHGDLYFSLYNSGTLDRLLSEGKEYIFVSNSDNLGAIADENILQHMVDTDSEFIMEVTNKTKADVHGGTLVDYEGSIRLLEITQVPAEHVEEFKSVRKFKIFNTNNLWISLKAVKRIMQNEEMDLEVIVNPKVINTRSIVQLETAAGAAIKHFKNACGINVPRSRFRPVKDCSDLLLVKSGIYSLDHGRLIANEKRMFKTVPVVKLGDHFRKIEQFQERFKQIPDIVDLDHLTVTGDVIFGRDIVLRGTVIIIANEGQRIYIPDGCILENRMVCGGLNMTEL